MLEKVLTKRYCFLYVCNFLNNWEMIWQGEGSYLAVNALLRVTTKLHSRAHSKITIHLQLLGRNNVFFGLSFFKRFWNHGKETSHFWRYAKNCKHIFLQKTFAISFLTTDFSITFCFPVKMSLHAWVIGGLKSEWYF